MVTMLDRKLLRDLWRIKTQVLTIALVVASGVGGFVASLSTYDSLRQLQARYYDSARFAQVFSALKRAPLSLETAIAALPGVADVQATIAYDVLLDVPDVAEPLSAHVIGLPDDGQPRINRLTLMRGRWIDAPDSNQVLINETFADARGLRPGDRIAVLLNGKRETLDITGIVLSPEYIFPVRMGVGDESSYGIFWIGRKRLAAAYNMDGAFNQVALRLAPRASEAAVVAALDHLLAPYGGTLAYGRAEQWSHRALTQEINEQRIFGLILPGVFLGVAVFLLNVVLTRQIGVQRGQIAALKALGYPDLRIGLHYLKFVLAIVAAGVLLGLLIGVWLGREMTAMYAGMFRFPSPAHHVAPWIGLSAAAAAHAGAALGALAALSRVVRLPPAEAMRPETPRHDRATVIERIGLGRRLTMPMRMILRDIERRPVRAAATVLGMSAAVAILISGTWWRDAVDHLLDVEFRLREREHFNLILADAVPASAIHDFARLPGVLVAEGTRDAPVLLRHGTRSDRTVIYGIDPGSTLRQLLDRRLAPVALPDAGIVINNSLAEKLGLRLGDSVEVDFLQGRRRQVNVTVTAIVAELMGRQAYMSRDALNRLLGEGDTISGVRITIDNGERSALLARLKLIPRVAVAVEIDPVIRQFRRTSGRFILVFTGILSVFASIIAIGVVYNNARIALAERAWELASLRVLGLTRGEVSGLLLGELGIELVLAVPLGWVLGYGLSWAITMLIHTETFEIPLIIAPRTFAYATLVTFAAGLVSALIVRRRIDRLDLVAVLKMRE